ncbi:MAG: hypothetical protein J6Y45_05060 [Bacteroidales bacterium]|nr:hypothetical protein [Bacteroidales bacterium]
MMEACYIQVLVPLRLEWVPVYRCPRPLPEGAWVTVPLGHARYKGVVYKTGVTPDVDDARIQDVLEFNEGLPAVSGAELKFWEFLSEYYLCTLGEVFKAARPAGKINGEQKAVNIMERLRQRLAVREEALTRKHKDSVRERLEAERDKIKAQIESLTRIPSDTPAPLNAGKPTLLCGPDRTAEYIKLCREALEKGFNALVLIPEIAAGEQLQERFEEEFSGQVHCVNSHLSDVRRRKIAEDVRTFGSQIVIGTRSSLFLPFSRLGLIIVENEQDMLYKQTEPSPRYNARDAAVMLGRIHGAKVVLGSPWPSLESLYNALSGKYLLCNTPARPAPVTLVDISAERRKGGMVDRISRKLLEAAALVKGPIALIRGWEKPDELTQEAARLLPGRQVDILTLQQARLSDLRPYALVAVLQADALFPEGDFRADERAVQALAMLEEQCSGTFLVQTAKADHPVFSAPGSIVEKLLQERKQFGLPPYTRLIDTDFGGHKERLSLQPGRSLAKRKQELWARALAFEKKTGGRARVIIDVDPVV